MLEAGKAQQVANKMSRAISICNRIRPSRIKDKIFTRIFKVFAKFAKTLKIQVKIYP